MAGYATSENPEREEFTTEGEAIAFVEGINAASLLLDEGRCILPTPTVESFVDGDKWIVEYSL